MQQHWICLILKKQSNLEYSAKHSFRGGQDCNTSISNSLNGHYHYCHPFHYLLWKYENSLRLRGDTLLQPSDFMGTHAPRILDKTIDHIAPKDPPTPYPEDLVRDCVHDLGNLVYMTRSMNSQKWTTPPTDMNDDFWNSTCASHREIKETIAKKRKWEREEIEERKAKLVKFALGRWEVEVLS